MASISRLIVAGSDVNLKSADLKFTHRHFAVYNEHIHVAVYLNSLRTKAMKEFTQLL